MKILEIKTTCCEKCGGDFTFVQLERKDSNQYWYADFEAECGGCGRVMSLYAEWAIKQEGREVVAL